MFNLIIVVSLIPFGWVYLQVDQGNFREFITDPIINWIGAGVFFIGGGFLLWRAYKVAQEQMLEIPRSESVRHKLQAYYEIQIRKFVQYELVSFIALVGMVLFQPTFFAIWYLFILFVFSLDWPKYDKVVRHLRLSKEEQELLAKTDILP